MPFTRYLLTIFEHISSLSLLYVLIQSASFAEYLPGRATQTFEEMWYCVYSDFHDGIGTNTSFITGTKTVLMYHILTSVPAVFFLNRSISLNFILWAPWTAMPPRWHFLFRVWWPQKRGLFEYWNRQWKFDSVIIEFWR